MFDFHKFCRDHSIPCIEEGHHHCHQGWVQTHCPRCAGGRSGFHLGFSLHDGKFSCWRCGGLSQWDVIGGLLRTNDRSLVYRVIQKYRGGVAPRRQGKVRKKQVKTPPLVDLTKAHRRYLESRDFDPELLIEIWGLKSTNHLAGKMSNRITYPIRNQTGTIVTYQGRACSNKQRPKYRLSEHSLEDPTSLLYGLDAVPNDKIVVVEGATDVWRLGPGAVGLLGMAWNKKQAGKLRQYRHRFILLDPGKREAEKAESLARWLSFYPGRTEIIEDLDCDPGDMCPDEAEHLMKELELC